MALRKLWWLYLGKNNNAPENNFSQELANRTVVDAYSSQLLTVYEGWSIKNLSQFFLQYGISGAPVIAADINASLLQAYNMMADKHIHRVFVIINGLLVGVISAMNI